MNRTDGRIYLILENGTVFEGKSFGAEGETVGELVFTTGMTGYIETVTDPSYYGQIVTQTFPLIGNYGMISDDMESSSPKLKAYIVREWCNVPSNFRSEGDICTFFKEKNVIGLYDIDTRALTKTVREYGVMNAKISFTPTCDPAELKSFRVTNAVEATTCEKETTVPAATEGAKSKYKIVLYDFGAKHNIVRELNKRGADVIIVPASTKAEEVLALKPDGIMLSNGAGDPAENTAIIKQLALLLEAEIPMFGICLGHQLLALAAGAKTIKLKYGHRGANHPVENVKTGQMHITCQNHGYAVDATTLPSNAEMVYVNINDKTCEGIEFTDKPVFSVQFHPEAAAGPNDTGFLFDRFLENTEKAKVK